MSAIIKLRMQSLTSDRPNVASNSSRNSLVFSSALTTSGFAGLRSLLPSGVISGSSTPLRHLMHRMTTSGLSNDAKPKA